MYIQQHQIKQKMKQHDWNENKIYSMQKCIIVIKTVGKYLLQENRSFKNDQNTFN